MQHQGIIDQMTLEEKIDFAVERTFGIPKICQSMVCHRL